MFVLFYFFYLYLCYKSYQQTELKIIDIIGFCSLNTDLFNSLIETNRRFQRYEANMENKILFFLSNMDSFLAKHFIILQK
ncbi:hypothetical protein SAMN05444371_3237 [Epilithonimonas mollis]|uniref:Uncharacterized protein n=1 Tax=Epilithonimonas mollis TaxID=216903 RepID=A0A1M6UA94_9FLAO|nr:hypothetical protein SAMN05444371_3237 [Epilithonimonas mollis]